MKSSLKNKRLSALIVNYNSGAWTQRCVESLQQAWEYEGGLPHQLEIIVTDSGSELAESTWWRSLRRAGVRVKSSPANVGYATGLNMALELSSGGPNDVVALLNPDQYFLPGSIGPLIDHLASNPNAGAVQPRIYLDEEQQVLLPPNELPHPFSDCIEALASWFPRVGRWRANSRAKWSRQFWQTEETFSAPMLSGSCVFMRRSTIEGLDCMMDGRFPLYFEDSDLCKRLVDAGFSLQVEPRSAILHHWSRCAGPEFTGEVAARHAYGQRLYMAKHHSGLFSACLQRLNAWLKKRKQGSDVRPIHPVQDLGSLQAAPCIELPHRGQFLVELSLTPFWGLSAGTLVDGVEYAYPSSTWSWLFPGRYYMRVLDRESGTFMGAWSFEKTTPSRSWPLDLSVFESDEQGVREDHRAGARVG